MTALGVLFLLLHLLITQCPAEVGSSDTDQRMIVDWERELVVYSWAELCYVAHLPNSSNGEMPLLPQRLYATEQLRPDQVLMLNRLLSADCSERDTWWLSDRSPNLPSLADYLFSYSVNRTKIYNDTVGRSSGVLSRRRRRVSDSRPSHSLRRRLHNLSRTVTAGPLHTGQTAEDGGRIYLSDNPYPSPTFVRSGTDRQRFKHYKAFYDEITRNSGAQSSFRTVAAVDGNPDINKKRNKHLRGYNNGLHQNVLNSYSLHVRNISIEQTPQDVRLHEQEVRQQNPQSQQQRLSQHKYSGDNNEISNNDKRHIVNSNSLGSVLNQPQGLEQNSAQFVEQLENDDHLHIPDSIIKDGQIFYRHDADADYENLNYVDQGNAQSPNDFDGIDDDLIVATDNHYHPDVNSMLFSQALGSTGSEGSFQAEAEGRGGNGESTHTVVKGGQNGALAAASAIRFDQQALAHVQVNPSTQRLSPSSGRSDYSPEITAPAGISPSDIEEMMKRNGYTGFAIATVSARRNGNNRRLLSSLGKILPGYSGSNDVIDDVTEEGDKAELDDKHDMVDSIVEQVYDPSLHGVIIDQGGLDGGAGDAHRESEFQQINGAELPEGGSGTSHDEGYVGLATYTQGIHGYPPGAENDYSELYYDLGNYNLNQPLYFPDVDYNPAEAAEIRHAVAKGQNGLPESPDNLPTNLNTGIQYPIIEGDILLPSRTSEDHMIVDNTLSSYFPQPQHTSEFNYPQPQQVQGNNERGKVDVYYVENGGSDSASQSAKYNVSYQPERSSLSSTSEQKIHNLYGLDDTRYHPSGNEIINYSEYHKPDSSQNFTGSINTVNSNDLYDTSSQSLHSSIESQEIWANVDSELRGSEVISNKDREHYPPIVVKNEMERLPHLQTNNVATQPAYNSQAEYEKSKKRRLFYEPTPATSELHKEDLQSGAYHPITVDANSQALGNLDRSQIYTNNGNSEQVIDDDLLNSSGVDHDDRSYDSSFETSPQSAQSVYTASHHYSYQHGSNERGIGSSTSTAIVQPQSPRSFPRQNSHPMQLVQPISSQGLESMRVLTPGRIGSMQNLPASDPNLPAVKVVMAEAPSSAELQRRMGKIISPGEKIPGTTGYMVPPGFRGRLVLGNMIATSMSSAHMAPGVAMHLANQLHGQMAPSNFNDNMRNSQMSLSSSSSAKSSNAGVSLSSSSSSRASGVGTISTTSSSSSNQMRQNNMNNFPASEQPIYSYRQTFNTNQHGNYHRPTPIVGPYIPNMNQQRTDLGSRMSNMPGMRSKSWSSWKMTSWRSGNRGMRSDMRNSNNGYNSGQYFSRSSSMPSANDCGYWSMRCNMIRTRFQQNEICRPTHIILPCCC